MVDTSHAEPLSEAMMRSSGAELGKRPETADQVRHRLSGETEGDLSPEEVEEIADEVIAMLRREAEFDRLVLGDDEWD